MKKVIRCMDCDKDITNKIKVYFQKRVVCEQCNLKRDV